MAISSVWPFGVSLDGLFERSDPEDSGLEFRALWITVGRHLAECIVDGYNSPVGHLRCFRLKRELFEIYWSGHFKSATSNDIVWSPEFGLQSSETIPLQSEFYLSFKWNASIQLKLYPNKKTALIVFLWWLIRAKGLKGFKKKAAVDAPKLPTSETSLAKQVRKWWPNLYKFNKFWPAQSAICFEHSKLLNQKSS